MSFAQRLRANGQRPAVERLCFDMPGIAAEGQRQPDQRRRDAVMLWAEGLLPQCQRTAIVRLGLLVEGHASRQLARSHERDDDPRVTGAKGRDMCMEGTARGDMTRAILPEPVRLALPKMLKLLQPGLGRGA